ncbi:MAG: dTDP-4-dehydrorhamnose reductase [Myxococcaceae bacterium]
MRIAVTGANGLVGSRLAVLLARKSHDVLALGRGPQRLAASAGATLTYASLDLADESAIASTLRDARPEVIVHVGAMTNVDACEKSPALAEALNARATHAIADAAKRADAHVVYVSTDYVFDGKAGPYAETDTPNPNGTYAKTKYQGEVAVATVAKRWAIARTAVVFGWPEAAQANFGSWLLGALVRIEPVKLFKDQFVSPSLADNVAEMLAELAERKLEGHWHTAGATVVNRVAFGEALAARLGISKPNIVPTLLADIALPAPRPRSSGLRVDRAMAELTAKPLGLDAALSKFVSAYRATQEALK